MTFDELVTKIDIDYAINKHFLIAQALRAVVEFHAADYDIFDGDEGEIIEGYWCKSCDDIEYPCPTIQAIEAVVYE